MRKYFERIDHRYAKICLYAGVTVLLTLAACMLLYTATPVFGKAWLLLCTVLEPLVYGAALSYVLNPLVKHVSRMLKRSKHYADKPMKRRGVAVALSLILVFLLLSAITTVLVLIITHSVSSLRWENLQALLGDAEGDFTNLLTTAEDFLEEYGFISGGSEGILLGIFSGIKDFFAKAVFAVIFCVYFLIDGPHVSKYLSRVLSAVFGRSMSLDATRIASDADRVFSGYFRGQAIDALIVGVLSGVILTAIGVPFGPVVGLLAGFGNMIPYVGGPVGFASVILVCLPSGAWMTMVWGLVAMGVVMFVDGNIINPKLLSDNVEVHPILVIAALIAGGAVGGIAGMLVAVPAAAFLKIQLDRWVEKREASGQGLVEEAIEVVDAEEDVDKTEQGD